MAILLFLDSFGHYSANNKSTKYPDGGLNTSAGENSSYVISSTYGRNGGGLRILTAGHFFDANTNLERRHGFTASSQWGFGFAFKIIDYPPQAIVPIFGLIDTGTIYTFIGQFYATQVAAAITKSQTIRLYSGEPEGTTLIENTKPLRRNAWHYIEADILLGSSGSATLKIDGETIGTFSGDTRGTGSSSADGIRIGFGKIERTLGNINGRYICIDDLYVTSGGNFSDMKIGVSRPIADGSTNSWSPSSGATNYLMVNEDTDDEDATYIFTSSPADNVFQTTDISSVSNVSIPAVQVTGVGRSTFVNPIATAEGLIKTGGVTYASATAAMGTPFAAFNFFATDVAYTNRTEVFPFSTNPATSGEFTPAQLSTYEFGVRRVS